MALVKRTPKSTVKIQAPTKPSTVFFGDNLIKGVRPNVIPQRYAKISFTITSAEGSMNQMSPSLVAVSIMAPRFGRLSLQDVVHDEMRLDNNEIECHMSPRELSKLELQVSLLEGSDEKDKSCEIAQLSSWALECKFTHR